MANVNVTFDEMETAAGQLKAGREEIVTKLNLLQTQIQNLVNSGFVTDQASGAFQATFDKFTYGAKTTIDSLDNLSQFLTGSAGAMRDLDSQIAAKAQA
jgi:WXG100 family type VII secretion target